MFTKEQTQSFRTLAGMFHPDKLVGQSDDILELGTKLSAALNAAKDKADWFTISSILNLVAKHRITKSDYSNLGLLWEEFDSTPKHNHGNSAKAEPKKKAEPKVSEEILDAIKAQQASKGWDRKKTAAWIGLEFDLFGASAKVYLDLVFAKSKGERKSDGWNAQFYRRLAESRISKEEFESWLAKGSDNIRRHRQHYEKIVDLANAIWDRK